MARITIRYYRIGTAGAVKFEDALSSICKKDLKNRELDVGGTEESVLVRLEALDVSSSPYICGEFVRRTLTGNPPEATEIGLNALALSEKAGLGYQVAFAYHPALQIIAIEHTPLSLSLSRIILYINQCCGTDYVKSPIAAEPVWERYNKSKARKLQISIANPTNLAGAEGEVSGVLSATGKLKEIFDAPVITIEVSMGHKKGWLNNDQVSKALKFFTEGLGKDQDVRSLKAAVKPNDDSPIEDLDFLQEILTSRNSIDLVGDPAKNYETRKAFVRTELTKCMPHLQKVYGA